MTKYNELVDHLVSTMKGNSMTSDVTNSPKDWEDFWYNSEDTLEGDNDNQEDETEERLIIWAEIIRDDF